MSAFSDAMVFSIDRSTPFDPSTFIGKNWSIGKQDGRSLSLTEVDLMKVDFVSVLKDGEPWVGSKKKMARLVDSGHVLLDAGFFWALWKDWKSYGSDSALEWIRKNRQVTSCDFPGTHILQPGVVEGGTWDILCLHWCDRWYWYCAPFNGRRDVNSHLSAILKI